jgi:hypothetical protein
MPSREQALERSLPSPCPPGEGEHPWSPIL